METENGAVLNSETGLTKLTVKIETNWLVCHLQFRFFFLYNIADAEGKNDDCSIKTPIQTNT